MRPAQTRGPRDAKRPTTAQRGFPWMKMRFLLAAFLVCTMIVVLRTTLAVTRSNVQRTAPHQATAVANQVRKRKSITDTESHTSELLRNPPRPLQPQREKRIDPAALHVFVMSGRANFAERQAVRATWGGPGTGIKFVVGNRACVYPPQYQANTGPCTPTGPVDATDGIRWKRKQKGTDIRLREEINKHGDILVLDVIDSYGSLSLKMLGLMEYVYDNIEPIPWIAKVDDDTIYNVEVLAELISRPFTARHAWIGHVEDEVWVQKEGKWMELNFNEQHIYPPYPQGSSGYAVSPWLIQLIVERNRVKPFPVYRCEDAAIGLWTYELYKTIPKESQRPFLDERRILPSIFYPHTGFEECLRQTTRNGRINYGHRLKPDMMRNCWKHLQRLPEEGEFGITSPPIPEWWTWHKASGAFRSEPLLDRSMDQTEAPTPFPTPRR